MASTVKEEHITKLRSAGYLSGDVVHRLPDEGQLIPTPRPHEKVVFLTQFIRGLGFPLHSFVHGLMFYYGLDFHDLAPNFVLNISAFIIVCEAFLRIKAHFGLWLKTFNVKPKVVSGRQAECGGAMVGKMPNVTWLGDVEPPRLPPLYGIHIGALEPGDVRHLTHHGTSALYLLSDHHLRLNIKGL